jgi:hypothetical protein
MPRANPNRVLNKIGKLHNRYQGSDRPVKFLKFDNTHTDFYKPGIQSEPEITELDPRKPAIIMDQPDEEIAASFDGALRQDQKIFKFVADSFQQREELSTLSDRCEDFLTERMGQEKGGILYDDVIYTIDRFFVPSILIIGEVAAQYVVVATAWKRVTE